MSKRKKHKIKQLYEKGEKKKSRQKKKKNQLGKQKMLNLYPKLEVLISQHLLVVRDHITWKCTGCCSGLGSAPSLLKEMNYLLDGTQF